MNFLGETFFKEKGFPWSFCEANTPPLSKTFLDWNGYRILVFAELEDFLCILLQDLSESEIWAVR